MTERVFTQKEAVEAYKALEKIKGQPMSWKLSYWITKLRKKLRVQIEFQQECEMKLIEKYGATVNEDGHVQLKTKDDARKFDNEFMEIGNIQLTDLHVNTVIVTENENIRISPEDMETLDGFVEFEIAEDTLAENKAADQPQT